MSRHFLLSSPFLPLSTFVIQAYSVWGTWQCFIGEISHRRNSDVILLSESKIRSLLDLRHFVEQKVLKINFYNFFFGYSFLPSFPFKPLKMISVDNLIHKIFSLLLYGQIRMEQCIFCPQTCSINVRCHAPISTGDISSGFSSFFKCLQFFHLALEFIGVYL